MEKNLTEIHQVKQNNKYYTFYNNDGFLLIKVENNNQSNYFASTTKQWSNLDVKKAIIIENFENNNNLFKNTLFLELDDIIISLTKKESPTENDVTQLLYSQIKELNAKTTELDNKISKMDKEVNDFINFAINLNNLKLHNDNLDYIKLNNVDILYTSNKNHPLINKTWLHLKSKVSMCCYYYGFSNRLEIPKKYNVSLHYATNNNLSKIFEINIKFDANWCCLIKIPEQYKDLYLTLDFIDWPYDKTNILKQFYVW